MKAVYVGAGTDTRPIRHLKNMSHLYCIDGQPFSEFGAMTHQCDPTYCRPGCTGYSRQSFLPKLDDAMRSVSQQLVSSPIKEIREYRPSNGSDGPAVTYFTNIAIPEHVDKVQDEIANFDMLIVAGHDPHSRIMDCTTKRVVFIGFEGTAYSEGEAEGHVITRLRGEPRFRKRFSSFIFVTNGYLHHFGSWDGFLTMANRESRVILVTGGAGLVGRTLRAEVNRKTRANDPHGYEEFNCRVTDRWIFVTRKAADLRDLEDTWALFEEHRPTHVIHLAAFVGGLFKNMRYGVEFFTQNMMMTLNILSCCREFGVKKCISCLSTCIFPDKIQYPIDEGMIHNGPPHISNEGYAYAKRMTDVLSKCYNKEYDCLFTSIIPTNIYGPFDNFSLQDGHVIPSLIHKAFVAKTRDEPLVVRGSGKPLRQFIYSQDLARLLIWTLNNYRESEPIILAPDPDDEHSIADIGNLISKASGIDAPIALDTSSADGQIRKTASNAKLRTYLPGFQFTPIDKGISETVAWFKENYKEARI